MLNRPNVKPNFDVKVATKKYLATQLQKGIDQMIITDVISDDGRFVLKYSSGQSQTVSDKSLAKIISRNKMRSQRHVLLHTKALDYDLKNLARTGLNFGEIFASPKTLIDVDEQNRQIIIAQHSPSDWVYIRNTDIGDWTVRLRGVNSDSMYLQKNGRFNKYGLTGCLTFMNVKFDNTSIIASNGACEDTINIIESRGKIRKIRTKNSHADALDIDGSELVIKSIDVKGANNDCTDFSGGDVNVWSISVSQCLDKGVSVGENGKFNADNVLISSSSIGISAKDYSSVTVNEATIDNVTFCYEAIKKKQEFGGAVLRVTKMTCDKARRKGPNSIVEIGWQ